MTEHNHEQHQVAQTPEQVAQAADAALAKHIVAKFDNKVDAKDFKFSFKTDKELGVKRPTVELKLPVLSIEGIVDILQNADGEKKKEAELLLEVLADAVYAQARSIVNDKEDISQENFPLDKVTWTAIANMPKAERRGGGISKETWEEFATDYVAVMPDATGKTAEQVGLAAKLLTAKFQAVKTQKPIIKMLQGQLDIYTSVSKNAEQFVDCIEFLTKKAEALLNMTDEDLLANL